MVKRRFLTDEQKLFWPFCFADCACTGRKISLPAPNDESVALHVAYEQKGTKWKKLTDAVTYFIVKGSLSIYIRTAEKVLFYH